MFHLDFEILRTITSFIKISSGHLIIKLIFRKFTRTIWEIDGQMPWDRYLAESLFIINFALLHHQHCLTSSSILTYFDYISFIDNNTLVHSLFVIAPALHDNQIHASWSFLFFQYYYFLNMNPIKTVGLLASKIIKIMFLVSIY